MKNEMLIMTAVWVVTIVLTIGCASTKNETAAVETAKLADGPWTTIADIPTGRWDLSTCVVDGKIYVIGGSDYDGNPLRVVEEFDPATETWTKKSDMPTARQGLSTSVVSGKIYAIGGASQESSESFKTVEEYDPATDTWTRKTDMGISRGWHCAGVVDSRIYIIGGCESSDSNPWGCPAGGDPVKRVDVYAPATDSWEQKTNIPYRKRTSAAHASVVDGKIYVFGGFNQYDSVGEFDPVTDTWTQRANMLSNRVSPSSIVVNGIIYIIGGFTISTPNLGLAAVSMYDYAIDTWKAASDMLVKRGGASASVVDGKIYVIGGKSDMWGGPLCPTVEVYDSSRE